MLEQQMFFSIVFRASLLPYLILTTTCMKRDTLMEHKKVVVVCEENGLIRLSYNILLTTLKTNTTTKHVIPIVTIEPNIQLIIVNEMVE
jgi:hypothetical protein